MAALKLTIVPTITYKKVITMIFIITITSTKAEPIIIDVIFATGIAKFTVITTTATTATTITKPFTADSDASQCIAAVVIITKRSHPAIVAIDKAIGVVATTTPTTKVLSIIASISFEAGFHFATQAISNSAL